MVGIPIAILTLLFNAYTRWRSANQAYYAHLSKVWYDLRKEEVKHPEWLNPEFTSNYATQDMKSMLSAASPYDAHAWACWALIEDWYETYEKPRRLRWLSRLPFHNELEQFEGAARSATELHWAWLSVPEHTCRFDPEFLQWIKGEFLLERYRLCTEKMIHKTGVIATRRLEPGQFIGYTEGPVVSLHDADTLQIGPTTHVQLTACLLRYLNHSENPNAVLRGRSLFALQPIDSANEITIDYNATEDEFTFEDGVARGYKHLSLDERARRRPRIHRWIHEREEESTRVAAKHSSPSLRLARSVELNGALTNPIGPADLIKSLKDLNIVVDSVLFDDSHGCRITRPGEYTVISKVGDKSTQWALIVDVDPAGKAPRNTD